MKKPKFLENRSKMPTAYVFVDYESWFYSMKNNYNVTPALDGWIAKMRKQYYIPEIYFFADYSDPEYTARSISCGNTATLSSTRRATRK